MKFKKYYKSEREEVPGYERDQIRAHIPLEQYDPSSTPSPIQHQAIHTADFNEDFLMETIDYENFQNMNHQYGNVNDHFIHVARRW